MPVLFYYHYVPFYVMRFAEAVNKLELLQKPQFCLQQEEEKNHCENGK